MKIKKSFFYDSLKITLVSFVELGLIAFFIFLNIDALDPFQLFLSDTKEGYESTLQELSLGKISDRPHSGFNSIYIVNVDTLSREDIGRMIRKINEYNPKVIGIDITFDNKKLLKDTLLQNALAESSAKLVTARILSYNANGDMITGSLSSDKFYQQGTGGYTNFVVESHNKIVRFFLPIRYTDSPQRKNELSFSMEVIRKYDPAIYQTFIEHRKEVNQHTPETIVYQRSNENYQIYEYADIFDKDISLEEFRDRIVLLGYIGDKEDMHFSPFGNDGNKPDMNGVVMHANIIEMILKKDWVNVLPHWLKWPLSFLICFSVVLMLVFANGREWPHWCQDSDKRISFFKYGILLFIFTLGVVLFYIFNVKIDTLSLILPIAFVKITDPVSFQCLPKFVVKKLPEKIKKLLILSSSKKQIN